ncbi:uncharacterized protein LOC111080553 [Drosophila obscura]|uniref:uncharacterized protein LOC111080553 n=1 Tax=Drosophila obscura TaxID=7282 RepID=UPI001BB2007B|nr:uncharacterized protein LOC111080553 [Drosophila obscura]
MACREPQETTAVVVNQLISDLVLEAVNEPAPHKLPPPCGSSTCQRLFDILGFQPYGDEDDADVAVDVRVYVEDDKSSLDAVIAPSSRTLMNSSLPLNDDRIANWHSWVTEALAEEHTEDDSTIYMKDDARKSCTRAVQTEQPRSRARSDIGCNSIPGDRVFLPTPCEQTRQTIYIDTVSPPVPNVLARPPLADRFCYMLTDFASALYCSLAIMCCCTPTMLR